MDILYFYIVSKVTINALSKLYKILFSLKFLIQLLKPIAGICKKSKYLNVNFGQKNSTLMQGEKNAN